jgi:S1-C subfamily serine protease
MTQQAFLTLAVLLIASGCESATPTAYNDSNTQSRKTANDGREARDSGRAREDCPLCVVWLDVELRDGRQCSGSGVLIGNGMVLTAGHVVKDAWRAHIMFGGRGSHPEEWDGRQQALHFEFVRDTDLAIIRGVVQPDWAEPATIATRSPRRGERVTSFGLQNPKSWRLKSGTVTNLTDDERGEFVADLQTQPGDSGGPVFNADGELVGLNRGHSHGESMIVDITAIDGLR